MTKAFSKRKLCRPTKHRLMMLKNMAQSLIMSEKICTTLPKARELQTYVEKIITTAKKDKSVTTFRRIERDIKDGDAVRKLFDIIVPRYSSRNGGYTQLFKLGFRKGDAAPMGILKLIQ